MNGSQINVKYDSPLWGVYVTHELVARSCHTTQAAAIHSARGIAGQLGAVLVVHDLDGSVLSTETVGRSLL
jgi:hypothetical protein